MTYYRTAEAGAVEPTTIAAQWTSRRSDTFARCGHTSTGNMKIVQSVKWLNTQNVKLEKG